MKFKIGDKVRIKEDLNEYNYFDIIPYMLEYAGKESVITDVSESVLFTLYKLADIPYTWCSDSLEPVEDTITLCNDDNEISTFSIKSIEEIPVKTRGFEIVSDKFRKHPNVDIQLPKRGTKKSAGYDVCTPVDIIIPPNGISDAIQTDLKAYMLEDEVLEIVPRSSIGFKKGLMLINTVGIIDSDYYSNPDNDGNIGFKFKNLTDKTVEIKAGERILQGIFKKYLITDYDNCDIERMGGMGSTGTK